MKKDFIIQLHRQFDASVQVVPDAPQLTVSNSTTLE
jgi:hypothetical protein